MGTELAHLLEHVVIELQAQASEAPGKLIGHTSWLRELAETAPHGYALMRTTVTFSNDFVALQSVKDACAIIEWAIEPSVDEAPDIDKIVAELRAIEQKR